MQVVARYADGSYTVRTYEAEGNHWRIIREVPANHRSVAQATLDGRVVDAVRYTPSRTRHRHSSGDLCTDACWNQFS